jgi:hypothetical protein
MYCGPADRSGDAHSKWWQNLAAPTIRSAKITITQNIFKQILLCFSLRHLSQMI